MNLSTNQWIDFLAGAGSIILTFQAGAEIDHDILKSNLKQSLSIEILSFTAPFILCFLGSYYIFGWNLNAAAICGIALSPLLMATGLTFGSISALFVLNHGFITKIQYSIIVTTVILSAVVYKLKNKHKS